MNFRILTFVSALLTGVSALMAQSPSPVSWVRDIPMPVSSGGAISYSDTAYDQLTVHQPRNVDGLRRLEEGENGSTSWNLIALFTGIKVDAGTVVTRDTDGQYLYFYTRGGVYQFNLPYLFLANQWDVPVITVRGMTYDGAGHLILASNNGPVSFDLASPTSGMAPLLPSGVVGTSSIGTVSKVAVGPDGQARLLDLENRRILTFATDTADTSDNFLGEFQLDINTTAINSLAMSPWGNIYVGDGLGGGSVYSSTGTLLGTFGLPPGTPVDPNPYVAYRLDTAPYINVKSDGTIYVSDITGFHQYQDATAVPEPSSYGLIIGGAVVLYLMRRRKVCA